MASAAGGAWCSCNDVADAGALLQGDHPVAMHTLAMLLLNTTTPQCPSAIGFLQNLAFRKPSIHHIAFGRHAWTRGNAHRAFFHFLAAGEAGAEIALMNAHWILARGCACLPPSLVPYRPTSALLHELLAQPADLMALICAARFQRA